MKRVTDSDGNVYFVRRTRGRTSSGVLTTSLMWKRAWSLTWHHSGAWYMGEEGADEVLAKAEANLIRELSL